MITSVMRYATYLVAEALQSTYQIVRGNTQCDRLDIQYFAQII